ncbi:3770_t:CDS:1, partial [Paraglomus occultum]
MSRYDLQCATVVTGLQHFDGDTGVRMAPKVGTFGTYRNRKSTESTFEQGLVYRNVRKSKVLPKVESSTESRKSYRKSKVLPKVESLTESRNPYR